MNWSITYVELMQKFFFYFDEINILVIGIKFSSLICYHLRYLVNYMYLTYTFRLIPSIIWISFGLVLKLVFGSTVA